jgi:hypothetical protein
VRVCENPAIAEAAADRVGALTLPLVCTYGWPSTAAHTLLARFHAAGVQLLVSADRDGRSPARPAELTCRNDLPK